MFRIQQILKNLSKYSPKSMKIQPIPLFTDNYAYLIYGQDPFKALLVDPGESKPLIKLLEENKSTVKVTSILLTHKHWDHAGGALELLDYLKSQQDPIPKEITVIGGADENIPYINTPIKDTTIIQICPDLRLTVFLSPCHTRGHVLYYLESLDISGKTIEKAVFTGDTLFLGGCGRFFEGVAKEMLVNFDFLASLPNETLVYCGHEYTVSNLEWAMGIEWENEEIAKRLKWALEKRAKGEFTVPGTIAEEKETNVFMRVREERIAEKLGLKDPVEIMGKLRSLKNENKNLKQ